MSLQPKPQLRFAERLAAERASDQGRTEIIAEPLTRSTRGLRVPGGPPASMPDSG